MSSKPSFPRWRVAPAQRCPVGRVSHHPHGEWAATKLLLDVGALTRPRSDLPASDNSVTIDLDDPGAVKQLRLQLEVMEQMDSIQPVEVATAVGEDGEIANSTAD